MLKLAINVKGLTGEEVIISCHEQAINEMDKHSRSGYIIVLIDTFFNKRYRN